MDYATNWIILLAAISQVDGSCELRNLGQYPCEGELSCTDDFGNAIGIIRGWSCRRRDMYNFNYAHRRTRVDNAYILYVSAENIDGTNMFDPFGAVNELNDHIRTLSIIHGKMNSVPSAIFNLQNAISIDLSRNTLESLNLEAFSKHRSLRLLNVSYNQIADLEVGDIATSGGFSSVDNIDLSHNAIETIPNNYFRKFPELLHLNLSHNYIKSFNILTFEGITHLQALYVSDNKITNLGMYFTRLTFLQELYLDQNCLTSIEPSNFNTMSKLQKLNISANSLTSIDDNAFEKLVALKVLDFSNNKINAITKAMFQHNTNLKSLDISVNKISKLEPGSFEGKSIKDFVIHNNPIAGTLVQHSFQGILVDSIDLSGANITELGPDLFDGQFQSLNFSRNSISKIHNTTFTKLTLLTDLDLSYNQLKSIDFDLADLNITNFYINNNFIKKITKNVFKSLPFLAIIDLSKNAIDVIETLSFEDLSGLKSLILNNNPLLTVIPPQLFSGLVLCTDLDFTNSKISTIQNNAFNGMESLKIFNSSHSNLKVLEVNVFNGTGSIEILDLSHNQIETLSLNNTNIKLVKKIYLQYNKLQQITNKTFSGLTDLRVLAIEGNNLHQIQNRAFHGLKNLLKIDLSTNKDMVFKASIFSDMPSLAVLLLNNVTSGVNFEDVVNTSIADVDLSFCDITDLNSVQVYQIVTLERLKLSSNQIRSIEKTAFQKLRQLSWVDLSYNRLSSIQPGAFSDAEDLSHLDLSNNFLSSLQFGVFDGLVNLKILDLSTNTLHSFSVSIFHNTPRVKTVYLDNNLIEDLDFGEFEKENIESLYIGGNLLPCDRLTKFKKNNNMTMSIKAKTGLYDKENVDGISCKSKTKIDDLSNYHGNETALTATLSSTLEEFIVTVERVLNRNETKIDLDSIGFKNVSNSIDKFLYVFNKIETKNIALLEKLMNINNSTNRVLENIQEYIKVRNSVSIDPNTLKTDESRVNYTDIEKFITDMLANEKAILKNEFKSMFDDWKSQNVGNNNFEAQLAAAGGSTDSKSALYFIATCLAALLSVLIVAFVVVYFKVRNNLKYNNHLSQSRQPIISNSLEME